MARTTIDEVKKNRLAAMTADERAVFDETYAATDSPSTSARRYATLGRLPASVSASWPHAWAPVRQQWPASKPAASARR